MVHFTPICGLQVSKDRSLSSFIGVVVDINNPCRSSGSDYYLLFSLLDESSLEASCDHPGAQVCEANFDRQTHKYNDQLLKNSLQKVKPNLNEIFKSRKIVVKVFKPNIESLPCVKNVGQVVECCLMKIIEYRGEIQAISNKSSFFRVYNRSSSVDGGLTWSVDCSDTNNAVKITESICKRIEQVYSAYSKVLKKDCLKINPMFTLRKDITISEIQVGDFFNLVVQVLSSIPDPKHPARQILHVADYTSHDLLKDKEFCIKVSSKSLGEQNLYVRGIVLVVFLYDNFALFARQNVRPCQILHLNNLCAKTYYNLGDRLEVAMHGDNQAIASRRVVILNNLGEDRAQSVIKRRRDFLNSLNKSLESENSNKLVDPSNLNSSSGTVPTKLFSDGSHLEPAFDCKNWKVNNSSTPVDMKNSVEDSDKVGKKAVNNFETNDDNSIFESTKNYQLDTYVETQLQSQVPNLSVPHDALFVTQNLEDENYVQNDIGDSSESEDKNSCQALSEASSIASTVHDDGLNLSQSRPKSPRSNSGAINKRLERSKKNETPEFAKIRAIHELVKNSAPEELNYFKIQGCIVKYLPEMIEKLCKNECRACFLSFFSDDCPSCMEACNGWYYSLTLVVSDSTQLKSDVIQINEFRNHHNKARTIKRLKSRKKFDAEKLYNSNDKDLHDRIENQPFGMVQTDSKELKICEINGDKSDEISINLIRNVATSFLNNIPPCNLTMNEPVRNQISSFIEDSIKSAPKIWFFIVPKKNGDADEDYNYTVLKFGTD